MIGRPVLRIMRGMVIRYLLIWGVIIMSVTAGIGIWQDGGSPVSAMRQIIDPQQDSGTGEVTLRQRRDGHFYADLMINGKEVHFLVDTGATDMVLTQQDANRIGLDQNALTYDRIASTANGTVKSATVRLDEVSFGPFNDRFVPASVNGADMNTSLLGMNYLRRFDTINIAEGEMVLKR